MANLGKIRWTRLSKTVVLYLAVPRLNNLFAGELCFPVARVQILSVLVGRPMLQRAALRQILHKPHEEVKE